MPRSQDFADGAERVRSPQFESIQQQANRNFQAISVLDNVMPAQNGMGAQDLQRKIVGSQGSSVGRSETTYDKQLWLHHPEPNPTRRTSSNGDANG